MGPAGRGGSVGRGEALPVVNSMVGYRQKQTFGRGPTIRAWAAYLSGGVGCASMSRKRIRTSGSISRARTLLYRHRAIEPTCVPVSSRSGLMGDAQCVASAFAERSHSRLTPKGFGSTDATARCAAGKVARHQIAPLSYRAIASAGSAGKTLYRRGRSQPVTVRTSARCVAPRFPTHSEAGWPTGFQPV